MPRVRVAVVAWLLLSLSACVAGARSSGPETRAPSPSASVASPDLVVAVKGDWGAGTPEQRAITARMCAIRRTLRFTDVLTVGDNFYAPDGRATRSNYEEPERCLTTYPGHRWRATWGNHDLGGLSTGAVLGARRFYTWSAAGVAFFALDSNAVTSPVQREWLRRRLAASRARVKIAYFHHPPFTVGGHPDNADVTKNWVPLFERYHVTLVLAGHNHDYEHLRRNGIDYVVTGGGGRFLTPCFGTRPILLTCRVQSHFLLISVSGARVTVRAILADGKTLDEFSVTAR